VDTMTLVAKHNKPKNPRRITPLGALKIVDPGEWERQIRAAMNHNDGRVREAAADLGVHSRTLWRWLQEPAFRNLERAPTGRPEGS
jgi:ActR/RegA family two-component response regulator